MPALTKQHLSILHEKQLKIFMEKIVEDVKKSKLPEIRKFKAQYGNYEGYQKWTKGRVIRYLMKLSPCAK